nr:hypothetical protein [Paraburkholderia sp. NMBU_R16]
MNVAAAFHSGGSDVALIDADPQNTSLRWATSGEAPLPMTVQSLAVAGKAVGAEIKKQAGKFDAIVVTARETWKIPEPPRCWRLPIFALSPWGLRRRIFLALLP